MILKKYQFPINIFIVFEKLNIIAYTSKLLMPNHYVCFLNKNWFYSVNLFLKNEIFSSYSSLIDNSCIDTLKYNDILPEKKFFNKNKRFIIYNIYYMYFLKIRLSLIQIINLNSNSIDLIYNNSSWLEREISEMYGINYLNKNDNRSLLLDYSRNEFPLLKDFPVEGFYEIYYDFFENKLTYIKNEFVEL